MILSNNQADSFAQTPAISIRQPWAELILSGRKTIEVRSWTTEFRGSIWVHSGIKADPELEQCFGFSELYKGGYLGKVVVEAIIPFDLHRWELWRDRHLCAGNYVPGLYAWILSSPEKLSLPVRAPGKLKLYYPPHDVEDEFRWAAYGQVLSLSSPNR